MNKKNFDKIVLVSLCDDFSNQLGKAISQDLDMVFCDAKELVEYELFDKKAIEELCSVDYLKTRERRVMKHIASFENVVVSISFDYLMRNLHLLHHNSLIVFVKLSKSFVKENGQLVDLIVFEDRTEKLEEAADVCLPVRKTEINFVLEKVIESLRSMI